MDAIPPPRTRSRSGWFVAGLCLLLVSCAGTPPAPPAPAAFPPADTELPGGFARYPDERVQSYVQGVGDRLLRSLEPGPVRLRYIVTDNPGFAAVVSRAGNVYISRGLLVLLQSEAELAAVLAHETAHYRSGHGHKTESEAMKTLSRSEQLANRIGGSGSRELTLTFGRVMVKGRVREQELEADRISIGYLVRAGYDPHAAIDALQMLATLSGEEEPPSNSVLDDEDEGYTAPIFRDHPEPGQRIAAMKDEVRGKRNPLSPGDLNREAYLRAIDGLVFDGDGQGFVRRGGNLYFPQAGLMLRLKEPWRMVSLKPGRIKLSSADGRFRLLVMQPPADSPRVSENLIQSAFRQDPPRRPRPVRFGAYRGYRHDGTLELSRGRARADAVFIDDGKRLVMFTVLSELATPAQELRKQADDLAGSLREMNGADRAAARPLRVRIRSAGTNVTFRQLAGSSPLMNFPELYLRLLNRRLPGGEPKPGEPLKIVQ